jgi:hypothetical protein
MCIGDVERHVVINGLERFRQVLIHELVHAHVVREDGPPRWLNEGVAQVITRRVTREEPLSVSRSQRQLHRSKWQGSRLQALWSGAAFTSTRRGDRERIALAYGLAEALTGEIAALSHSDFRTFVAAARRADGGEAASRQVYGLGLETWAARVLGPGDWRPMPQTWPVKDERILLL